MYEVVLYVHILSAIAWVGGAFFLNLLSTRVTRTGAPEDLPRLGRQIAWFGVRYFLPISIVTFLAGAFMTASRWSFGELWISISMTLWLVSVLLGALYIGPRSGKVAAMFEAEGPTSTAARAAAERLTLVSRIDIVLFLVIVALMVFKPDLTAG